MVSTQSLEAQENAKNAVREFMMKNGRHDTTVHERVQAAVVHETIVREEHEYAVSATDRETHIDHFHTSIQPITDEAVLEEEHHSNILPREAREFEHDDRLEVQRRVEAEQAKFRDKVERIDGQRTKESLPVGESAHYHHHVREIIQPVVNKRTIEPHIIHTVQTFHEVHHQAAQHHSASALPTVTMAEFLKQGGGESPHSITFQSILLTTPTVLTGREERYDWFEGEPRSFGGSVGNSNTATSGSPAETSTQGGQGLSVPASGGASTETKDTTVPASAPAPTPAPTSAPMAPPERRSSLPATAISSTQPTTTSSANTTNPSPNTNNNLNANPGVGPAHPGAGRWSLLPLSFARSDADASRAGHPPTRATAHAPVMQALHPAQARSDQQQQQQQGRPGSVARPSSVGRPTEK